MRMRTFWNNHIGLYWNYNQIRGQTFWMFHLKTSNLEIAHATNAITRPTVSIHSMHFVFPFCLMNFIIIPISKKTWEIEATLFSDFSTYLPLIVSYAHHSYLRDPKSVLWDFFHTKFTLRNLLLRSKASLMDRGLAEFIFPNTTFINERDRTCFCCKFHLTNNNDSLLGSIEYFNASDDRNNGILQHHYNNYKAPQLVLNERFYSFLLTTSKDDYTFLSCGDPTYDAPDFLALFMPFTKITWALTFMTIFGWPLVLSLIENDLSLKKVLRDFDALFIGWAMILEQSHLRATNYKGRGPLYCYCGCVLLAILILSNAYKGDNIRALTKSFDLVPLTHMEQLISAGYKKYNSRQCFVFADDSMDPLVCLKEEFYNVAQYSRNQYTDKQYRLWEPLDYVDVIDTDKDVLNRGSEWFGECREKKALLGWRSEDGLVDLERKLRMKHKSAHISLGEEFIFTRRKGWHLVRYGSIKYLKRMWTLVECGVYNELLNISYKLPTTKTIQPRKLAINGNIFVQFVFFSFGLILALLTFIAKFHKTITWRFFFVRDTVSFLVRNYFATVPERLPARI